MKLSIVATLYQSAPYINEFHERASATARRLVGDDYEIVLVNDGSPDESLALALQLQSRDCHVQVVELSRNFGHHAAIVAGLAQARGDQIFLIDSDLEEQPEWLLQFAEKMEASGADVVFGVQQGRVASFWSNFSGELFWSALNFLSSTPIPHNPMTCRLMRRCYVDALLEVGDRVLYLAGTFAWTGFKQMAIPLMKTPRPILHKSTYDLSRKLMQVADSFSSFSIAPLSLIFFAGLLIWFGSVLFGLGLVIRKLIEPDMVLTGFTSIMLSIWFLGGSIILVLGVLGMYVGKIFQEVKRRPLYIIKNIYKGKDIG
ncbi:glycosyltransferase family 2 protein [Nitrosomonas europaea]|uniref:glycosyltransferase family 2 protein n=1 Tax=Nitrosomonas europaea TaxID=915 RepID=UPI002D05A6D2|nr:glycosyltransferase family 2 protein [Nitrosomonas europaea]HRN82795.1 glycosyltransferase family 2 protein [Nitrosomonas europaea]